MIKRFSIIILILFVSFLGCEKDQLGIFTKKNRLTQSKWRIKTFINNSSNNVFNAGNLQYKFEDNGDYIVTDEDLRQHYSTWEFVENGEYIRIGNNTFKVKIISNRLLGLRYGDVEIFYVPVN